jgi:DNA-binding winged helix-turn-helix (wHTH) protein/Tfp pilus assembly protein PilF
MERFFTFGPYQLDCERHLLLRDGEPVSLHVKALQILMVLVQHRGEVVSKDEMMKAVWPDAFVEEANPSQNVFVLRKALGERPKENRYIATVPGRGYSFVASVDKPSEGANHDNQPPAPNELVSEITPKLRFGLSPSLWLRTHPASVLVVLLVIAAEVALVAYASVPGVARFCNNRGVIHQQKGELRQAIREYQRALMFKSNYAEAHYNLADAYEEIPDYVKALEQYQSAIDIDPTFYPAYNNLSRLYILREKDPGAALRLLDRAISLQPKEPSVQYTLYKNYGWANLEMGQMGQAEQNLRIAVGLNPQRGSAHCLRAMVMNRQGKPNDALPEWESCLRYSYQSEVEPEWRNAAQEVLRIYEHPPGG